MRLTIAVTIAAVGLAGCDKYTWERPGTTDTALQADYGECRRQAQSEAFRTYAFHSGFPVMGPGYWGYRHQPDYWYWRQRLESERFFYENRLANFCMRNKGYTLVKVADDVQAVPPAAPAPPPASSNTQPTR
ncbi:MAG TPA: hypothetical protein VJ890_00495 [Vineibacter sp.]|nr:hypothetical protein [Vineibacter sp.]